MKINLRNVLSLICWVLVHFSVLAQNCIEVSDDFQQKKIGKNLLFIEATAAKSSILDYYIQLTHSNQTYSLDNDIPHFGFQNSPKYALFKICNLSKNTKHLILEIAQPSINYCQLYKVTSTVNSSINFESLGISGDTLPFEERTFQHRYLLYEITLPPFSTNEFMLYFHKNGALSLPIQLYSSSYYYKIDGLSNLAFGIYCGAILLIVLVAFLIGLIGKRWLYVIYALYSLGLLFQIVISEGYGFMLFYPNGTHFSSYARGISAVGALLAYVYLTQLFLQLHNHLPKFNTFLNYFILFMVVFAVLAAIIINLYPSVLPIVIVAMYFLIVLIFALTLYAGISSIKYNKTLSYLYLCGYCFVITGSLAYLLSKIGWLPYYFITRNGLIIGSALEITMLGIGLALYTRRSMEEKNRLQQVLLNKEIEINKALLNGENKERKRIAQDLHDGIGVQLRLLKNQMSQSKPDDKQIELIDQIAEEIRTISHNLMPANLHYLGLENLVSDLIEDLSNHHPIDLRLVAIDCPFLNDQIMGLSLYRIVQECIQNAIQHSEARTIIVQLVGHDNELSITIEDDGKGLSKNFSSGIGLSNVKSRVDQLNGQLTIDSDTTRGTIVCITILLPNHN
jgi:signal transduction histidine kinase